MSNKNNTVNKLKNKLPEIRVMLENAEKLRKDNAHIQEALKNSEEMFMTVAQATSDAIIIIDKKGIVTFWNNGAEQMFGYSAEEMCGQHLYPIIPEKVRESHISGLTRVVEEGKTKLIGKTVELTAVRKTGEEFPVELTLAMRITESNTFFSGIVRDITDRKNAEARLNHLAFFDMLTGLPNRMLFFDRLTQILKQAQREKHLFALFFIDIDKFKAINDTLGHDAGDYVLAETARRLTQCVRQTDTVARMGGDEFTILLSQIATVQDAAMVSQKIMTEFSRPFIFKDTEIQLTASIGISLYPYDGKDEDALIKYADVNMYKAKKENMPPPQS